MLIYETAHSGSCVLVLCKSSLLHLYTFPSSFSVGQCTTDYLTIIFSISANVCWTCLSIAL